MNQTEKNLNAVIFSLNKSQKKYYSVEINLTLTYLEDIKNNKVPKNILDEYEKMQKEEVIKN